jgi:hypothetical protein
VPSNLYPGDLNESFIELTSNIATIPLKGTCLFHGLPGSNFSAIYGAKICYRLIFLIATKNIHSQIQE